jgi:hypothetical protein
MINASKRSLLLCIALLMPFIYLLANSTDYHSPLKPTNSPFTFTETEITAHPSETVQVCVDKQAGGLVVFGTTSIVVDAIGNTSPHLSGFAPVTLAFPFGVTQACFDLSISNANEIGEYILRIQDSEEKTNINVVLDPEQEKEQIAVCGVASPLGNIPEEEAFVVDRFGNSYSMEMIRIKQALDIGDVTDSPSTDHCNCEEFDISLSLFQPFFEDCILDTNDGFDEEGELGSDRRRVVCEALSHMETIIIPNTNICPSEEPVKINLQIQPSDFYEDYNGSQDLPAMPDEAIAAATSYIPNFPSYYGYPGSIIHGAPWIIINSGEYPFVDGPEFYHARMRFNIPGFEFNTDFSLSEGEFDGWDLYTTALHELVHTLGFASSFGRISSTFGSVIPSNPNSLYYPFDKFLSYEGFNLINPFGGSGNFPVNPIQRFSEDLDPLTLTNGGGCPIDDSPDVIFNAISGSEYRIFRGNEYAPGTSFSHIHIQCGEEETTPFVMNPFQGEGEARRTFQDAELDILRTLGYNIDCDPSDYETFDCLAEDCAVGSTHNGTIIETCALDPDAPFDYTLEICPPSSGTLHIPVAEILHNDAGGESLAFALTYGAFNQTSSGQSVALSEDGTELLFTANTIGMKIISYAALGCGGQVSNGSLIYINVTVSDDPECLFYCGEPITCDELDYPLEWGDNCLTIDEDCTTNSSCNLICNGGFCGAIAAQTETGLYREFNGYSYASNFFDFQFENDFGKAEIPGWVRASGSPFYITDDNDGTFFANHAILLVGVPTFFFGPNQNSEILTFLPMEADESYLFSFDRGRQGVSYSLDLTLIHGEDFVPNPSFYANEPIGPIYEGTSQNISLSGQLPEGIMVREAGAFTAEESFSAIWIHFPEDFDEVSSIVFDNFEVVEDNFTAGENLISEFCSEVQNLGGIEFCMLSDVEIRYDWYELDADSNPIEPPLHTYTQINGVASDVISFEVAPMQTTSYRLIRTIIDDGGMPPSFTLPITSQDITVTVEEEAPSADFTWELVDGECGVFNYFSDTATDSYSHTWYLNEMTDESIFSTSPNPADHLLEQGENIIIHRIEGSCGIFISSITLPDFSSPNAEFAFMQDCDNDVIIITASDVDGSHSWDINEDGIPDFTGVTEITLPIPTPTEPFIIVTHTVTNICNVAATITEVIDELEACPNCPCEDPDAININIDAGEGTPWQQTALIDLVESGPFSPNIIDLSNRCVSIQGRLLIEPLGVPEYMADLLLIGGALRMEQGSEIVIQDGADLLVMNVNEADTDGDTGIHACGTQWQGITIEGGGELRFYGSQIEDAIRAIRAQPNATLDVSKNVFNNNNVGIQLGESTLDLSLHQIDLGINGIINNTFENGNVGISAIQTRWVVLGSLTGEGINTYRNLGRGVFAQHGNVGVYNSTFQDIALSGIQHFTGNGFLFAFNNFFDDMDFGIRSLNASILAENNFMTNISNTGIQLEAGLFEYRVAECSNNTITADIAGIDLVFQAISSRIRLDENEIILTPTQQVANRSGIRILGEGENATSWDESLVRKNTITINSTGTGIELMDLGNIDFHYNTITFQAPLAAMNAVNRGISLENADNNYLYENTVGLGAGSADFINLTAFHLAACPNTLMCCNNSDGGNIGFLFSENCENTQFRNSNIGNHVIGLEVNVATTMSTQTHAGNMWEGNYTAGARNWGNVDEVLGSIFQLESPNLDRPTLWPEVVLTPNAADGTWFQPWPGNASFCETDVLCLPAPPQTNGNIKDEDLRFVQGSHLSSPYGTFLNWEGGKYLYGKLEGNTNLVAFSSEMQQFYNNTQQSPLAQYYALSQALKSLTSENSQVTLGGNLVEVRTLLNEMTELELRYNSTAIAEEREQISAAYDLVNQEVTTLMVSSHQLQLEQTEVRIGVMPQLIAQNNGLSVEHDYAQFEKQVNGIQLARLQTTVNVLETGALSTLETIAYLCPLDGGNAVYRARAMLKSQGNYDFTGVDCSLSNSASEHNNIQQNDQTGNRLSETKFGLGNETTLQWSAFPNPTQGDLSLLGGDVNLVEKISLMDINGKRVTEWSGELQHGLKLPAGLVDGVYLLRIQEIDGILQTIKIIISN